MPATDYQGSSSTFASIGRSILSNRRDQVHGVDAGDASGPDHELDAFQRHITDLFLDLSGGNGEVVSLLWIQRLLDAFLICQEEFRVVLFNNRASVSRPPLDRSVAEFFDRCVRALDVCNAVRDGLDQVRQWCRHIDIVVASLGPAQPSLGEGQLRRAKKALAELSAYMSDENPAAAGGSGSGVLPHRNRSFGRSGGGGGRTDHHQNHSSGSGGQSRASIAGAHFRSLSWSVSRSWSAARQLQAIANNLSAPRANEIAATGGLALPIYIMNSVLLFVMWALVAAIPCQDRGLQTHISIPRSFPWAAPILSLHEKILEESKKLERRNSCGLLKEIQQIEKHSRQLIELTDEHFPLQEDKEVEIRQAVQELADVCNALKEDIDPLERQVREVFHRIVRSRTEGLDCLSCNPK